MSSSGERSHFAFVLCGGNLDSLSGWSKYDRTNQLPPRSDCGQGFVHDEGEELPVGTAALLPTGQFGLCVKD